MKNIKKVLSLLLAMTVTASLVTVTSFAATPATNYAQTETFNRPKAMTSTNNTAGGKLCTGSPGYTEDDFAAGLFGKYATDYAVNIHGSSNGIRDYAICTDYLKGKDAGTTLHYGYEFAFSNEAAAGTSHWAEMSNINAAGGGVYFTTAELGNTVTSKVIEFVAGDEANTVKLFGVLDAECNWNKGEWTNVDIFITTGNDTADSYMSIYVNGLPLKLKDGKTIDGVKTTTQNFVVDANQNVEGIQAFTHIRYGGYVRFMSNVNDTTTGDAVYFDNLRTNVYQPGSDTYFDITRPAYDALVMADTDFSDDVIPGKIVPLSSSIEIVEEDGNKYLKQYANGKYYSLRFGNNANLYDVIDIEFDVKPGDNTRYVLAVEESGGNYFPFADSNAAYYAGKGFTFDVDSITSATADSWIGSWINHKVRINAADAWIEDEIYGSSQHNKPTVASKPYGSNADIRVLLVASESADSYLGMDNLSMVAKNFYPMIDSLSYTEDGAVSTGDIGVSPDIDEVVVNLDGKICDTSAENIDKIKLVSASGSIIDTENVYDADSNTITLTLNETAQSDTIYKVIMPSDLMVYDGVTLGSDYEYSFKTEYRAFEVKSVKLLKKDKVTEEVPNPEYGYHTYGYITDKSTVNAEITMTNTTGEAQNCTAIFAVYNASGVLIGCDIKEVTVGVDGSENQNNVIVPDNGIYLSNSSGVYIRAYVWDSIDGMKPLNPDFYLWHNVASHGGVSTEGTTPSWGK